MLSDLLMVFIISNCKRKIHRWVCPPLIFDRDCCVCWLDTCYSVLEVRVRSHRHTMLTLFIPTTRNECQNPSPWTMFSYLNRLELLLNWGFPLFFFCHFFSASKLSSSMTLHRKVAQRSAYFFFRFWLLRLRTCATSVKFLRSVNFNDWSSFPVTLGCDRLYSFISRNYFVSELL